jgi:hypothetical protein
MFGDIWEAIKNIFVPKQPQEDKTELELEEEEVMNEDEVIRNEILHNYPYPFVKLDCNWPPTRFHFVG